MGKKATINLTYSTYGYTVKSVVNTLHYKPGDVLDEASVRSLIREGFTVKVTG